MSAKEGLIGGHILIEVIGRGAGAKLQMKIKGEHREGDANLPATILEPADLAWKALGNDPTLRVSTRGGEKGQSVPPDSPGRPGDSNPDSHGDPQNSKQNPG